MPTPHREGPYRFRFVSHDCNEPSHVHVIRDRKDQAKVWLEPVEVAWSVLSGKETREAVRIIKRNRNKILEVWHDHCSKLG